jgi:hypothetical protein
MIRCGCPSDQGFFWMYDQARNRPFAGCILTLPVISYHQSAGTIFGKKKRLEKYRKRTRKNPGFSKKFLLLLWLGFVDWAVTVSSPPQVEIPENGRRDLNFLIYDEFSIARSMKSSMRA